MPKGSLARAPACFHIIGVSGPTREVRAGCVAYSTGVEKPGCQGLTLLVRANLAERLHRRAAWCSGY